MQVTIRNSVQINSNKIMVIHFNAINFVLRYRTVVTNRGFSLGMLGSWGCLLVMVGVNWGASQSPHS